MTNVHVLQIKQNIHEKYNTHSNTYKFGNNKDQHISANNILGMKLCLAMELTSEGSVKYELLLSLFICLNCMFVLSLCVWVYTV